MPYRRLEFTHWWQPETFLRLGRIRDAILQEFREYGHYDALLMVDSDLLIHPALPAHLESLTRPIVSEVFWTKWRPHLPLLPQVWQVFPGGFRDIDWIAGLVWPGQYQVAGLGACTLIRRFAAQRLSYASFPGLETQGEDRHFSLRAHAAGFPLYVDTVYPAYHVYRDSDLVRGQQWLDAGCPPQVIRCDLGPDWYEDLARWWRVQQSDAVCGQMFGEYPDDLAPYAGGTEPWVIDLLTALCRSVGAKRALEIGVFRGRTTEALAQAVPEVVGVDTQLRPEARDRIAPFSHVRLIEGDAVQVIPTLEGVFQFVYVDDGHTYEAVKAQTAAVWPKVAPGGILAYHDYYDAGVGAFIREQFPDAIVLETRPFIEQATGLALVQKRRADS